MSELKKSNVGNNITNILETIFNNDSILKMIESIENFKKLKPLYIEKLDIIKSILVLHKNSRKGYFKEKYDLIRNNCLNEIKRIFKFDEESIIISTELFIEYVKLVTVFEFSFAYQIFEVKRISNELGNSFHNNSLSNSVSSLYSFPIKNLTIFENNSNNNKEFIPIPITFNHNGSDYTIPIFSLNNNNNNNNNNDESISKVFQSFYEKVKSIYIKIKRPSQTVDPLIKDLESDLKNLEISNDISVDELAVTLNNSLSVSATTASNNDNSLLKEIFNSHNLNTVLSNIQKCIKSYTQYEKDLKILLDMVVVGKNGLESRIKTAESLTLSDFKKFGIKDTDDDNKILNSYLNFRLMFEIGYLFTRNKLKLILDGLDTSSGVKNIVQAKAELLSKLCRENQPVQFNVLNNCSNPQSFRTILKDEFSFELNSNQYSIECLKYGNDKISNIIQNSFKDICKMVKSSKEQQQPQPKQEVTLNKSLSLETTITTNDNILFKEIFNSHDLSTVILNVNKCILLYPQYDLKVLLDMMVAEEKSLLRKMKTAEIQALSELKRLNITDTDEVKLKSFLTFRLMIETGFLFTRNKLKLVLDSNGYSNVINNNDYTREALLNKLCAEHQLVSLGAIYNCSNPQSFRKILKPDFSFTINTNSYTIDCLKFGDGNNISNSIQTTFEELWNMFKQNQLSTGGDELVSKLIIGVKEDNCDIFSKIFKSSNLESIKLELDRMIVLYPKFDLTTLKEIIEKQDLVKRIENILAFEVKGTKKFNETFEYLLNNKLLLDGFIALKIMIQVDIIFKRKQRQSFIKNNSWLTVEMKSQLLNDFDKNCKPIVLFKDIVESATNPLLFRQISKDFIFTLNSQEYTISTGLKFDDQQNISTSIQSAFIKLCNLSKDLQQQQISKLTPTPIPTLTTTSTSTSTSTSTPTTTTPTTTTTTTTTTQSQILQPISVSNITSIPETPSSIPSNVYIKIFKSEQVNEIIKSLEELIIRYPIIKIDLSIIKQLIIQDGKKFKAKIETITRNARDQILKGENQSLEEIIYCKFVSLRIMVEFNSLYQRVRLKEYDSSSKTMNDLSNFHNNQSPFFYTFLLNKTYTSITSDYSFNFGGSVKVIPEFKFSNTGERISSVVNLLYNEIKQQLLYKSSPQPTAKAASIPTPIATPPSAIPINTSPIISQPNQHFTNNFLLVKVFKESNDVKDIYNSISTLLKSYPNCHEVLNLIKSAIDDSKIQFNQNLKSARTRLNNQFRAIKNSNPSKDLIFNKSMVLVAMLEFNKIYQLFELKKVKGWATIHSEFAKHIKSRLSLSNLIQGKYLDSFSSEFKSSKLKGAVISPLKCSKSGSLSVVSKFLFNEIHQILKQESLTKSSVGAKSKLVLVRDQVDVISMESKEIIEVFLKSSPSRLSLIQANNIKMLTDEYDSHADYKHSLIPLLTEEYRAQLETSFNEIEGVSIDQDGTITGLNYIPMNQSIEIKSLEELSDESINVKFLIKLKEREDEVFSKDLLLFKCVDSFNNTQFAMGKVSIATELKGKFQTIDVDFVMSDSTRSVIERLYSISVSRQKKSHPLSFFKISNCITFLRELEALERVEKSTLFSSLILKPNIEVYNQMVKQKYEIPSLIKSMYISSLNDSQYLAITESLCVNGINLIQGPPGTGKTHTIHSLISILMSINPSFKILVCAPSHAAVDEVAKRVLNKRLINANGQPYLPNIIRIGKEDKISSDVHEICLFKIKDGQARIKAMKSANILFSTLSASGSNTVIKYFRPSIVIVDESTQSTESSTIIPLGLGAKKLVLVGDPLQLPPTIFSKESNDHGLNISLFERLAKVLPVIMLDVQYRMHPLISRFPSNQFYRDRLKDGANVKLYQHEFYSNKSYGPIAFFDITDSQEERGKISVRNVLEVEMVFTLIKKLVQDHPICKSFSYGIITPYKLQRKEIEEHQKSFNQPLDITCNTVDGFQGAEKDIIIFSCVRNERIGFLSDRRRINVGVTRAKFGLFIIGNKKLLKKDRTWAPYIQYIESIQRFTSINSTGINKLKKETIQFDLLHPDGLLTEIEHLENEEFDNQNIGSSDEDDGSEYDDDEDDDQETSSDDDFEVTEIRKIINQEDDDDDLIDEDDEDEENEDEEDEIINEPITKNSLKIDDNYPLIILNIINQLQKLNLSGKIDSSVLHNKKLLRDNFKVVSAKFLNYISNILNGSINKSSSSGSSNYSTISHKLLTIKSNIECKKKLVKEESFNKLKKVLFDGFASCTLDIYGSFVSGLSLNDSDLDVVFTMQHKEDKSPLSQVSSYLNKTGEYKIQEKRFDAKVPIIRFKDLKSGIHFDMCSNSLMGRHNSLLLREYVSIDSRVKDLILLVKWWATNKDLNDASMDTLSSFSLVNMVIHFLQQISPPILPNLQNPSTNHYESSKIKLKSNVRIENYLIKYYDHTTITKFNSKLNTSNIGQLFYKFFYYYSTFDYNKSVISISNGACFDKSKATITNCNRSKFVVQDPFITDKNITASLKPMKFKNYLVEIILMEYQLRNFNDSLINNNDVNELFYQTLSLSSHNLTIPKKSR